MISLFGNMFLASVVVFISYSTSIVNVLADKTTLTIGGFAGISIKKDGWSSAGIIPAVELALARINNYSDILQNYYIVVDWKDSRCSSGNAIKGLVELISEPPNKIAFLGPGCSIAACPIIDAAKFWNLLQIGYSASDTNLFNKDDYPNFYPINPSEDVYDPAILAVTDHFKWNRLFIVKHETSFSSSASEDLECFLLKHKKVEVIGFMKNASSAVQRLKTHDARILIVQMYENRARDFVCSAFHQAYYGSHIVFIIRGWFAEEWWKVPHEICSVNEMETVLINVLLVQQTEFGENEHLQVIGLNRSQFTKEYETMVEERNDSLYEVNEFATFAYDSILVLALTLNKTEEKLKTMNMSLKEFNYSRSDITDILKHMINQTDINGLTGRIKLNTRKSRYVNIIIQQQQDFKVHNIATYFISNKSIGFLSSRDFHWLNGETPLDKKAIKEIMLCISRPMFNLTTALSSAGIVMAVFFWWINNKNREKSVLKMSSPPLNNILIMGCIISYLYVPLTGLKSCGLETNVNYSIVCKVLGPLFSVSITLQFGTIFVKTWRIYRIFTNAKLSKQLRFLSNNHLMLYILLMVLVDLAYFLAWNIISPIHETHTEIRTDHLIMLRTVYYCRRCTSTSFSKWLYGVAAYKGILLLLGMFLTWETRNVTIPGLNDSKNIGLCVYNIVIFLVVVTPVQEFMKDVNYNYVITSGSVIFCTSVTLLLMFVPKIMYSDQKVLPTQKKTATSSIDEKK